MVFRWLSNKKTGYEITLQEFKRLLQYPPDQTRIAFWLLEWFHIVSIVPSNDDDIVLVDKDGTSISVQAIHKKIQKNKSYQYKIYQEAMNIWR